MKENVIENIVFYALVTVIIFIGLGVIFTSPEKVICEDEEYIYTEKYSLFNRDTVVYKYSKPICYSGVCVAKNKFRTYNGASKTRALFKQVTISYIIKSGP